MSVEDLSKASRVDIKLIGDIPIDVTFASPVVGFKSDQNYTKLVTDWRNWGKVSEAVIDFDDNLFGKITKFKNKLNRFRSAKNIPIRIGSIAIKFMSNIDQR